MHSIKGEHSHTSIIERWQAVDEYFVCISECDFSDQVCTTRSVLTHLKVDDEPLADVAAFRSIMFQLVILDVMSFAQQFVAKAESGCGFCLI